MAPRPYWKGYLKLSLVTCPVEMTPATSESQKVRFHTLNRKTSNRIVSHYIDSVTGKEVADDDEVKGYERGENDFLILEDEELQNVSLESARTIDIDRFVPKDSIEWIWLEKPNYLSPSDPVGEEAFAVIRDAMTAEGVVGVSRLVIGRRERGVVLEPAGKGIIVWTLRYADEIREEESYFEGIPQKGDDELMPLVQSLIKQEKTKWDLKMVADPVQEQLLALIESKRKAIKPTKTTKPKEEPQTAQVIDIMAALKESLNKEKGGRKAS